MLAAGCSVRSRAACSSMPKLKKHVAASRSNGSKASNKGKITAEKVAVLRVVTKGGGVAGPASIGFEYAWRAKLHKNAKYIDEQRVEERLAAAAAVVRERYLPGVGPADDAGAALARARAILEAYAEATSAGG